MLLKHSLESGLSKTAIARQLGVNRRVIYHWITTGQLDRELSGTAAPRRRTARDTKLARYGRARRVSVRVDNDARGQGSQLPLGV